MHLLGNAILAYSSFDDANSYGAYNGMGSDFSDVLHGWFYISQKAGIYMGAIAIILAGLLLLFNAHRPKGASEAKSHAIYVVVVVIAIFGVINIMSLVEGTAL